MKNIFLLLLLITGMVEAQIVSIPDANFKAKLISLGIDSNSSGEIDTFETTLVSTLHLENSNINNLIGISEFTNLNILYCDTNNLTFLDLSSNINLTFLSCRSNQIAFLNLSNNPNLTDVLADGNALNGINISNNPSLGVLWVANNNLTTLNTSSCINLTQLWCSDNNLTSINLVDCTNLFNFDCAHNQLIDLNLSGLNNLGRLICHNNLLSSLNLTDSPNLNLLYCEANQLTSLNLTGLTNLHTLSCGQNLLSAIDVSSLTNALNTFLINNNNLTFIDVLGFTQLQQFNCSNNQITSLSIVGCPNLYIFNCSGNVLNALNFSTGMESLWSLDCSNNLLSTLDITNLLNVNSINCANNQLITLFTKNGSLAAELFIQNNPNLGFICCDNNEVDQLQSLALSNGYTSCVINSYCFFTPGGLYNTISGNIKYDSNNNGCDTNDILQPNIKVVINDGLNQGASFTTNQGNYTFYAGAGSFDIALGIENPTWFTFTPITATIPFVDNNNNVTVQDFCIAPNGVHRDVEMVISPVTFARPGFNAIYKLVYRNKGNQTVTVYPNFSYNESLLDLISSSVIPNQINPGGMSWIIPNVQPFESGSIEITFRVNAPTDTPAVNIGDVLTFTSFVDIENIDENWEDNAFTLNQTVVGSYDPNNIICLEGDVVPATEIGNYLHYAINFENTGNFPAENVVVKTEIDATKFDISSLQLMNSNFPVDARITGNKVEFIFENIQLPIGGHGHILLKIKTQNTLVTGDAVANRGDIYFDYNFPIDTGLANTVFQTLSNSVFKIDNSVVVYPNPAVNEVTVTADNKIKSIQLYDAQGRIILTSLTDDLASKLDVSNYSKGIYFLKITTEKGAQVQKLLKD